MRSSVRSGQLSRHQPVAHFVAVVLVFDVVLASHRRIPMVFDGIVRPETTDTRMIFVGNRTGIVPVLFTRRWSKEIRE